MRTRRWISNVTAQQCACDITVALIARLSEPLFVLKENIDIPRIPEERAIFKGLELVGDLTCHGSRFAALHLVIDPGDIAA